MAKGAPPPFMRGRGGPPAAPISKAAAMAPPPRRAPPPPPATVQGPAADAAMANMQAGAPAFKKGGKVGGSFPKGKTAKMPR